MIKHPAAALSILGGLALATSVHAATYFQIDPNPGGIKLFLDSAKDAVSSFGSVLGPDDVSITVNGPSDFASGFSTIKPIKGGMLTDLVFTPTDPSAFDDFAFRGQDLLANQTISVIVTDNQGHAPETFDFTVDKADADFARLGIIAAIAGETIKSVEIVNSGGFKEAKQFEFSTPGMVPEPATWAVMLLGFGLVGAAKRGVRTKRPLGAG